MAESIRFAEGLLLFVAFFLLNENVCVSIH